MVLKSCLVLTLIYSVIRLANVPPQMVNDTWHIPALHHSPGLAIWESTYWPTGFSWPQLIAAAMLKWEASDEKKPFVGFHCAIYFPAVHPSPHVACLAHCRIMSDLFGTSQGASKSSRCNSLALYLSLVEAPAHCPRPAPPDFLVLPRSHSLQAEGGLQWRCPAATGEWHLLYMLFYVISCYFHLSINLSINHIYSIKLYLKYL